ncbi:hypothetical protein ACJJIW_13405 [Microbulbifer sp. JMSA004]|uniref:hypothetical protein n=1 Tax=Microbulbifer sp. JMSA004 TaxID=3243370 RepID=UPI00403A5032
MSDFGVLWWVSRIVCTTGVGVIGDPSEALNTDLSVFVDAYRAVYYPLAGLWGDAVGHYYDLRTSSTGDSNGQ